mmetsp:Transcript_86269/g.279301  ORF Transcript_86269/g.279301 Transcript_86269/m.279301 type:complete len:353 (+) Transcript_86269:92-1150(+)
MKFQKYLKDVQRSSIMLRHLNYKALKAEVRRLQELVELGSMSQAAAAELFGRQLEAELVEVERFWESCLRDLSGLAAELFSSTNMAVCGDAAHGALCQPLGPMRLLEPLNLWLPVAALADALSRHRLLQITAVMKIEKKFVKVLGVQLGPGRTAAELLGSSSLRGSSLHAICRRLEALGDAILRLGLGTSEAEPGDPCSICFEEFVDPARLACGHRFCIGCVLPLFDRLPEEEAGTDPALLRCPLCRAAGPPASQALCLDGLLPRLGRGLCPRLGAAVAPGSEELQRFTAVVVSSLARLASREAACCDEPGCAPIPRSKSLGTPELLPAAAAGAAVLVPRAAKPLAADGGAA